MDNTGDSSCESDRSDPWSFIDGDFNEPDGMPDIGSISEEPSDGESLEVIDEEERHEDENRDADVESDEVSIITESEVNDELVPLPVVISKEKKYLHHPNTYLNTRLNVLLALVVAAVSGLGLGHFLGLHEECPLPNESTTSLLEQLKEENALLQSKLSKHLGEESAICKRDPQNWKCDGNVKFQNEEAAHPQFILQSDVHEELLHFKEKDSGIVTKLQHDAVFTQNMKEERNQGVEFSEKVQNLLADSGRNFPSERNPEYITSSENNGFRVISIADKRASDNVADVRDGNYNTFSQFEDKGDVAESHKQLKYHDVSTQFQEPEIHVHSPSSLNEVKKVENMIVEHKNEELVFPLEEENNLFSEDGKIYVAKEEIVTSSVKQNNKLQNGIEEDIENHEGSSYMETIKSTLRLLQGHHYNNIISLQTDTILSSTIAKAEEVELSVQQLHKIVYGCELQKCDYNNKYLEKKMEMSINKLTETLGELVEYLDQQIYKFLNKMLQKLTKFEVKMQDKWCSTTKNDENKSDEVNSLLQIGVLLNCEDSNAKHKMRLYKVSSKENKKSQKTNAILREKKYFLKGVKQSIASNSKNQNNQYSSPDILKFKIQESNNNNNNDINNNIILNHDSLSENHFKGNTPSEFYETYPSPTEDHYVTKSYEDKYEEKKREKSNVKKQNKYENKVKHTFQEKSDEKSEFKKLKNDKQVLHSGELGKQYVKQGHGNSNSYEKSRKIHYINGEKKGNTEHENKFSIYEDNQYTHPTILGKRVIWVTDDSYKKSNISGDWMLKIADARAAQRKLHHRSDWMFDRAHARKIKREGTHMTGNWYFHRGRGREYCRIFPSSEWCKTEHFRSPSIDKPYINKYNGEAKFHHISRWSKKFFERPAKWIKNSITNLHNKIKYQSYR